MFRSFRMEKAAGCLLPHLKYRRRFLYEDNCSDHVILISNYHPLDPLQSLKICI